MTRLLTVNEAAAKLGVSARALRRVAERLGFLIKIGRAVRIDPNDLGELVKLCRVSPKEQDCIAVPMPVVPELTKSETAHDASARALATADALRKLSRDTLPKGVGQPPAPVIPLK